MRLFIVVLLAVIALGAAGVWALGEFGHAFTSQGEARAPIVREPEIVAASADAPLAQAAPNSAETMQSAPASDAPSTDAAPFAEPAPAPTEPLDPDAPSPFSAERFDDGARARSLDPRPGGAARDSAPEPAPAEPDPPQEEPQPPQAEPEAPTRQAATAPDDARRTPQPMAAPAPGPAAGSLEAEFKSRRVTYNRPPAKLALNKPIDVSLVINATENEDAGRDALQGFPGEVVERDVDLSDTVSAHLTGVGFDIASQSVERQKLSGRTLNRWQWRVTPTELGTRTLILEIFGYASGSLDAEPLDAYRDEIIVEVEQFDRIVSWARSVQPVFAVLAALAGAASAVFAFLRFREEKKRARR